MVPQGLFDFIPSQEPYVGIGIFYETGTFEDLADLPYFRPEQGMKPVLHIKIVVFGVGQHEARDGQTLIEGFPVRIRLDQFSVFVGNSVPFLQYLGCRSADFFTGF